MVRGSVGVGADMCLITRDHADMIWSRLTGHPSGKRIRADTRAGDTMSPAGREIFTPQGWNSLTRGFSR